MDDRVKDIGSYIRRNHRLEAMMRAVTEADSTVEALKVLADPFADSQLILGSSPCTPEEFFDWEENHIFNEVRLYDALGKDDARSVLGVWRRFREMCELIALTLAKE